MKGIWTALLFMTSLASFGQSCDTIDGTVRNCFDANGLKQGYWEYQREVYKVSSYGGYGTKEGCQYSEHVTYAPESTGYFKDDYKVGKWKYYDGFTYNEKRQIEGLLEKEITYNPDGSVIEDKNGQWGYYYSLRFNVDTSAVDGYFIRHSDTIWVECLSATCHFTLTNENALSEFSFNSLAVLEEQLFRLTTGLYDRDIWEKRKN